MSKIITVFGATGNQGGSVIAQILADSALSKEFKIRGITRDVSKPASKALEQQGVEMTTADLNSKDSVKAALKDSHSVFLVTNYWETVSKETELTQGKNVADASKELGVQHLIFSSLLHVTNVTNGRLPNVPHFDGKADIEQYIRDSGVPATFYMPGYFMSNFEQSIRPGQDGVMTLALPVSDKSKFPLIDIKNDTGKFVAAILKNRDSQLGNRVLGAQGYYTPQQIMDGFSAVTGKKAQFAQIPADMWKSFLPEPVAQELLENHLFIEEPGYYNDEALEPSLAIVDKKLVSWEDFVKASKAFQ